MDDNIVYLCNCYMLDVNHEHTVNFNNRQSQLQWFNSKCLYYMTDCKHLKKGQSVIVPVSYYDNKLQYCNYCYFLNDENRIEYYFIIEREYVNEYNTKFYLKLDVFQTYYFDISFSKFDSLIDRVHLPRWNTTTNLPNIHLMLEDEGLEVGEYEIRSRKTIFDYSGRGSFIATSSSPLSGKTGGNGTGGSTSGGYVSSTDLYKEGRCSDKGLWFIKQSEGFYDHAYDDGYGYMTIGYGTTKHGELDAYNELLKGCTEQKASKILGDKLYSNYSKPTYDALKSRCADFSKINQQKFDALVSLVYNCGTGILNGDLFTMVYRGDSDESIVNFWKTYYIKSNGVVSQGLKNRRVAETNVYSSGSYYWKDISINGGKGGVVTENNGMGYIPPEYRGTQSNDIRSKIVASAEKLLGKPYRYGGNYPPLGKSDGTDCSGLCQWAYNDNGIRISRTTYTQIKEGKLITQAEARQGDLVFTRGYGDNGHVVMFLSNNPDGSIHVIEAKETGTNIMYNDRTPNSQYMFRNLIGD